MAGLDLMGKNLFGETARPSAKGLLAKRFMLPPFSILNAREGAWQARKAAWLRLGIKSEIGRGGDLAYGIDYAGGSTRRPNAAPTALPRPAACYGKSHARGDGAGRSKMNGVTYQSWSSQRCFYVQKTAVETKLGRKLTTAEFAKDYFVSPNDGVVQGTSIFDPVLCELAYTWFCPPGGQVVDSFAGGSVRGITAALLGYRYWGADLSAPQIAANEDQAALIVRDQGPRPVWVRGDSALVLRTAPAADFLWSCPPYGDLEQYSRDPADLSTMAYPAFLEAYKTIIRRAAARLRPNRFAAWVVGEFRDSMGMYRNFVGDTIEAFRAAGMAYYNEAILITAIGSLPIRAGKQFTVSRKLGKTHQNLLVFVKGDPKAAAAAINGTEEVEADE